MPALPPLDTLAWSSITETTEPQASARQLDAWREVVALWLNWNAAYENITERLFSLRHDQQALEDALDELDQVRQRAVCLSRQLVE
jgi:hypothetical protein